MENQGFGVKTDEKMRRMRIKRRRPHKILFLLPVILVLVVTVLLLIDARVRPMLRTLAVNQARTMAVEAIDREVSDYLASEQESDNGYLKVSKDSSGRVISIESDAVHMNQTNLISIWR